MFILQVSGTDFIDQIVRNVENGGVAPAQPNKQKEEGREYTPSTDEQDSFEAQAAKRNTNKLLPKGIQLAAVAPLAVKASDSIIRTAANFRMLEGGLKSTSCALSTQEAAYFGRLANSTSKGGRFLTSLYKLSKYIVSPLEKAGGFLSSLINSGQALEGAGALAKTGRFLGSAGRFLTTGVGGRVLPILGAAIAVVDCGKDLGNYFGAKQAEGETKKEFDARVSKAGYDAAVNVGCTATGAVIGGIIGSIVPGAGTALGAMVGAGIGNLVGNLFKSDGWGTSAVKSVWNALF